MKRYAYTFQNIAYITRMKLLLEALKNDNIHLFDEIAGFIIVF